MPSMNRRTFLAGSAALGTVGGGAFLPPSLVPDSLAERRARLRPVPEVSARPPVADAHVADAIADLEGLVDRARRDWDRVENRAEAAEDLPKISDPERALASARGQLDSARGDSGWHALFDVRRGVKYAGEAIGGARLASGDASGDHLAEQARDIQAAIADERDRIRYEVSDPSAGLARLYWVEKWLALGHLNSYRDGTYRGQDEPTAEYDDRHVVRTWGSHMQARRYRADAARLYDEYRADADGTWTDVTDHVETAAERLHDDAREGTFDADEFDRRNDAVDSLPEGPYRTFRWFAMFYVQNADVRSDDEPWAGVPLYRAVQNAETVLRVRAFESVRADESFAEGEAVTGEMLDRAKQRGLSLLRDHLDAAEDRPVLALLLREGRRLLWAGDTEFDNRGDVPNPHARAYAKYRLAAGYLKELEAVTAVIDRPENA